MKPAHAEVIELSQPVRVEQRGLSSADYRFTLGCLLLIIGCGCVCTRGWTAAVAGGVLMIVGGWIVKREWEV